MPCPYQVKKDIWDFLRQRNISLSGSWIPSAENKEADMMSRLKLNSSEWKLNPRVFRRITKLLGTPDTDNFASRVSHQLDRYMSLIPEPGCIAANAMRQDWKQTFPYLFPPFSMIGAVLKKLRLERIPSAILVFPLWRSQSWFPSLMEQCCSIPLTVLVRRDTLINPKGESHPLSGKLTLCAAKVTGVQTLSENFLRQLEQSSKILSSQEPGELMKAPGKNGQFGLIKGVMIPCQHLWK